MPTITRRGLTPPGSSLAGIGDLVPTGFTGLGFAGADDSGGADAGGWGSNEGVGPDDGSGDGTDMGGGDDLGGWGSNEGVGPEPDAGTLPSTPTPGQGSMLPPGGTGGHPSAGLPLPTQPGGGTTGNPKTPGTGGGFVDDLTKLLSSPLGGLLGGFLSGLGQSLATPHRQSFAGTAADPVKIMGDLGPSLKNLIGGFQDRVNQGVSLPDAYVDLRTPVFTGGGMPMPVGIVPKGDASIGRPATLTPSAGIVPRSATTATETGVSTQTPDVNLPGTTPGQEYALTDPKQRALAALSILGVS